MPIEIRMPVMIVGTPRKNDAEACSSAGKPKTRDTFIHSCRTLAAPTAVLISIGHSAQMKMMKIAEILLSRKV